MLIPKEIGKQEAVQYYQDIYDLHEFSVSPSTKVSIYEFIDSNGQSGYDGVRDGLNKILQIDKDGKSYLFYYPYRSKIDIELVKDIAICIDDLIDKAKILKLGDPLLKGIKSKQSQLVSLLREGTDNPTSAKEIMGDEYAIIAEKHAEYLKMIAEKKERAEAAAQKRMQRKEDRKDRRAKRKYKNKQNLKAIKSTLKMPIEKLYQIGQAGKAKRAEKRKILEDKNTLEY